MLFQKWSSRFLGMLNYAKKHLQGQSWLLSFLFAMEFGVGALVLGPCASVNVAWNVFIAVALVFLVLREWRLRLRVEELCRSGSNGFCSHCVCRYSCEREVECCNGCRCRIRGCVKEENGDNKGEEEEDVVTEMRKEMAKEKEHRDALALELEKERMAASSAADEAMAMILRLQSEKALVEREAHQYRTMAEQKQLYDQEIIESLRWIIVRLEEERRDGWKLLEKI